MADGVPRIGDNCGQGLARPGGSLVSRALFPIMLNHLKGLLHKIFGLMLNLHCTLTGFIDSKFYFLKLDMISIVQIYVNYALLQTNFEKKKYLLSEPLGFFVLTRRAYVDPDLIGFLKELRNIPLNTLKFVVTNQSLYV